jgi:hypothetical protein
MARDLIDQYASGGEKLSQAIRGLTREDLLWKPGDGAEPKLGNWSIQEVVIHLMDSDLIGIDRMKRMIAMENPLLTGYDETLFTKHLMPEEQSAEDAVRILDLSFKNFARVLRKLPDAAFGRQGNHNERGVIKLGDYVKYMIDHLDHHIRFIHAKRAAMGKEMW